MRQDLKPVLPFSLLKFAFGLRSATSVYSTATLWFVAYLRVNTLKLFDNI